MPAPVPLPVSRPWAIQSWRARIPSKYAQSPPPLLPRQFLLVSILHTSHGSDRRSSAAASAAACCVLVRPSIKTFLGSPHLHAVIASTRQLRHDRQLPEFRVISSKVNHNRGVARCPRIHPAHMTPIPLRSADKSTAASNVPEFALESAVLRVSRVSSSSSSRTKNFVPRTTRTLPPASWRCAGRRCSRRS